MDRGVDCSRGGAGLGIAVAGRLDDGFLTVAPASGVCSFVAAAAADFFRGCALCFTGTLNENSYPVDMASALILSGSPSASVPNKTGGEKR